MRAQKLVKSKSTDQRVSSRKMKQSSPKKNLPSDERQIISRQIMSIDPLKHEGQQKEGFPFSKSDANKLFKRKKNEKSQPVYTLKQAKEEMKQGLLDMEIFGYDFVIKTWHFKPDANNRKYWQEMRRRVYLRFQCPHCQKKKRWTSMLGTFEILFKFWDLDKFYQKFPEFEKFKSKETMKYPKILEWNLRIYRMKCLNCHSWGRAFIYQNQLKACIMDFCRIIADILAGVKPTKHSNQIMNGAELHNHKKELCQACHQGVCFYRRK